LEHSQYGGSDLQKGLVCRVARSDLRTNLSRLDGTDVLYVYRSVQTSTRVPHCCNDGGHHTHRNTQVVVNHIANHVCFILGLSWGGDHHWYTCLAETIAPCQRVDTSAFMIRYGITLKSNATSDTEVVQGTVLACALILAMAMAIMVSA